MQRINLSEVAQAGIVPTATKRIVFAACVHKHQVGGELLMRLYV